MSFIKRVCISIVGLILCGVGVSLMLLSDLGVDPNSVFVTGIAHQLGTTYGSSSLLINGIILTSVYFLDNKFVNISSIMAIFLIGYTVDISLYIFHRFEVVFNDQLLMQLLVLAIGLFIMCFGVVTYIDQKLGIAAFDSISEIISKKMKLEFRYVRMSIDIILMLIGWVLGGAIGIGTIIVSLLTGPSISFIRSLLLKK